MNNEHGKQQRRPDAGTDTDTATCSWGWGSGLARLVLRLLHLLVSALLLAGRLARLVGGRGRGRDSGRGRDWEAPRHVVLQVERAWPECALAALPWWSLSAGVTHLSFYDPDGVIGDEKELMKAVENYETDIPGHILWRSRHDKNGFGGSLTVDVIRREDCKPKIVNLVKDMSDDVRAGTLVPDDVDINFVDKRLKHFGTGASPVPDPDLSIYCGERCSTNGLLPWNIRLTEFIAFTDSDSISIENFHRVLREYSKHEQRFGK